MALHLARQPNKNEDQIMRELKSIQGFVECLTNAKIPYTLALTGSTARGELRKNLGQFDYKSDTDVLCIIAPCDIAATLFCKKNFIWPAPLILMSTEALDYPSNAILSIAFDSLITNELYLLKPVFTDVSTAEFIAYQLQPLAYYSSQLHNSTPQAKRRLYSKIAITCLKLLYLVDHSDRRSFVYEKELYSHHFVSVDETLIHDTMNRSLPDKQLRFAAECLEALVLQCPFITKSVDFLKSTRLYYLDKNINPKEIIDAVFLENNRLTKSESLFIKAV